MGKYKKTHELYSVYRSMKYRCYCKGRRDYKYYGARDIKVCDRWLESKNGFWNFVKDMGKRPVGYSLDRIDNNGDYTPQNCRWSCQHQQVNNRRNNLEITGVKGMNNSYRAYFTFNHKRKQKQFKTLEEAMKQRELWEAEYFNKCKRCNSLVEEDLKKGLCECCHDDMYA